MTAPLDPQLNDSDLELLSAYIDSQLTPAESAQLEERLRQEPVLRLTLDELRATVGLLHELEPLPPPRSFTLDRAVVQPRRAWSLPWMGIGSALVGLLCVVALTTVMFSTGGRAPSAPMAAQEAAAPTAAPAAAGGAAPAAAAATAPPAATAAAATEPTAGLPFNEEGQGVTARETDPQLATAASEPLAAAPAAPAFDQSAEPSAAQATAPPEPFLPPMGVVQGTVPPEPSGELAQAATGAPMPAAPAGQRPALATENLGPSQTVAPITSSDSTAPDTVELAPSAGVAPLAQPPRSSPFRLIAIIVGVLLALILGAWALRSAWRRR